MKQILEVPVDITNEFCYNDNTYRISPTLSQYEVKNYPIKTNGKYNDWTNESDMDSIIVIDSFTSLKFLDQNGLDITNDIVQV